MVNRSTINSFYIFLFAIRNVYKKYFVESQTKVYNKKMQE